MRILVTGVSSGIGLSLARRLREHELWGVARRNPPADLSIHFISCDVSDWTQITAVSKELAADWGSLDAIIHCAGSQGVVGPSMQVDPLEWASGVRANLEGAFFVVRGFYHLLIRPGVVSRRKIILFSGGGASKPRPNFSAYACAKTGLVRLAECLAAEWKEMPIDINIVAPGAINTAMTREIVDLGPEAAGEAEFKRATSQLIEGGDSIEKLHELILFLLSPQSDGITGRFISAQRDRREWFDKIRNELAGSDIFTLRRIIPEDRGLAA